MNLHRLSDRLMATELLLLLLFVQVRLNEESRSGPDCQHAVTDDFLCMAAG